MKRSALLAIVGIPVLSLTLLSGASFAEGPGKGGQKNPERHRMGAKMQLAEYYLLDGQYEKALGHFQVVATHEGKGRRGSRPARDGKAAESGERARGGKRHLRPARLKFRAHLGAAASAQKLGKTELAQQWAERALEFAQKHGLKRGVKVAERFLKDPDEVTARRAPTAQELEKRIQMMDSKRGTGK
jgi:tetratricopeptide (TPR) repeat protein